MMMIPIPRGGVLKEVRGQAEARAVPGIEEIAITAHPGQDLVPLPEGASYLGFILARAETPERGEPKSGRPWKRWAAEGSWSRSKASNRIPALRCIRGEDR